jgi:hypothetical protein
MVRDSMRLSGDRDRIPVLDVDAMNFRINLSIGQTEFEDLVHGHDISKFGRDSNGNMIEIRLTLSDFGLRIAAEIVNNALQGR